ncbi:hypothetical protein FQZ97_797780 [compost metagenome]
MGDELHVGIGRQVIQGDRREQLIGHQQGQRDIELPGGGGVQAGGGAFGFLGLLEDVPAAGGELFAGGVQADAARAANQQGGVQPRFQCREGAHDGRRREVQVPRRRGEAARLRHLLEHLHLPVAAHGLRLPGGVQRRVGEEVRGAEIDEGAYLGGDPPAALVEDMHR